MAWRFALMIDPAASDDERTDFADTFTVVDPTAPALNVSELSTQRGDGIFESIGVVEGHAQETQAHLDRLAHSAQLCDLPVPHAEQWRQAVALATAHTGPGEGVIKLILSRGRRARPGADRVGHVGSGRGLLAAARRTASASSRSIAASTAALRPARRGCSSARRPSRTR